MTLEKRLSHCNAQVCFLHLLFMNGKFEVVYLYMYGHSLQVEFLVTKLCDSSSIGELELKVSTMKLNLDVFISTILFEFSLIMALDILSLTCFLLLFLLFIVICPNSKWYQLAGFHLHIVRDLTQKHKTLPPPIPASVSANNVIETPKTNGSVSTTSLAISKPVNPVDPISSPGSIQKFLDRAADEGLVIIPSPKVRI